MNRTPRKPGFRRSVKLAARVTILSGLSIGPLRAADDAKAVAKPKEPRVALVVPPVVVAGASATVKVRGLGLAGATAARFPGGPAGVEATVKSAGKAEVKDPLKPAKVGDTQVEVELKVPADVPAGPLPFVVVTPAGETEGFTLLVVAAGALVDEKEPNPGFRAAQEIKLGQTASGGVGPSGDVDVYKFEAKSGQQLVAEVTAARAGSPLDAALTLYDAAGHLLATVDDTDGSADPVLRAQCPSDGAYYLAVIDANDKGGPLHVYALTVKAGE